MKDCKDCGVPHEYWWDCPLASKTMNYGWKFAARQNDARREAFYAKKASDPFGSD